MKVTHNGREKYKVGDWVSFPYGAMTLVAQIIEARGPLGVNGRHIYRIRVPRGAEEPDCFEMPGDEMERASPPETIS